jgi:hypothetical protein
MWYDVDLTLKNKDITLLPSSLHIFTYFSLPLLATFEKFCLCPPALLIYLDHSHYGERRKLLRMALVLKLL